MDKMQTREVLRQILDIITKNLHYLEEGEKIKEFLDESLQAMYLMEKIKDEFFEDYDLHLVPAEYETENPIVYVVFLALSGLDETELFEDSDEFLDWVSESCALGVGLIEDFGEELEDLTLDIICSYMKKFEEE